MNARRGNLADEALGFKYQQEPRVGRCEETGETELRAMEVRAEGG